MSPHDTRSRLVRTVTAAATIAVWAVIVGGSSAVASCGDWLGGHSTTGVAVHAAMPVEHAAMPVEEETAVSVDHEGRRTPPSGQCDGPNCRRRDRPPAPTDSPAGPTPSTLHRDGMTTADTPEPPRSARRLGSSLVIAEECFIAFRVDRPPRV